MAAETRVATKAAARRQIHPAHNPCLVQHRDGKFEAFPLGHPLPAGARVIERVMPRATGPVWRDVETGSIVARA